MLASAPGKQLKVLEVKRQDGCLELYLESGMQRLTPVGERSVRVQYTQKSACSDMEKLGVLPQEPLKAWEYREDCGEIELILPKLRLVIDKQTNQFRYYDEAGKLLLKDRRENSKELEEFTVYQISGEDVKKEYIDTPDGRKEVIREAARIPAGSAFHTRLHLEWDEREALYGLGQHEEGYASLRGNRVYLHQANRKIAIPVLVSTKGYGILVNTYSPAIFNDTVEGSYFYTEADPEMDFYFMNGSDMDGVVREYRRLTGAAAMLPKWAFGYVQSQERYETQEEILQVAGQYRERGIGLDCIVLDWCSWEGNQWGQKTFDAKRFPAPDRMLKELHDEHVHFMLSIWPNMAESTGNYLEFQEKGQLLPGCAVYNALSKEARETYWSQLERELFCHGVDAWWCDSSEPFTPEWNRMLRPESSQLYEEYCRNAGNHLPAQMLNAYGFYHAMGIYEGQRRAQEQEKQESGAGEDGGREERTGCPEKRVVNLTRSGYLGQQRYGAILWSGDIAATWDTLRRQIAAGLHFCASGLPYWTVDIGAFFVKNGTHWFWKGDYDLGAEDPGYCELFVRWFQWGAFLPMFRGHGTEVRRELWNFDRPEAPFYEAIMRANRLRYELMPYIYSLAGAVWKDGASMIKPLAFGFAQDPKTWDITDQYLFGDALMVCPVTRPMYYGKNGKKLAGTEFTRSVYLPEGTVWYDYWTRERYEGGRWITVDAPLEKIPLFVRAGSILPVTRAALSTEEQTGEITFLVYEGADGSFELYEDAGDGYAYESGEYRVTQVSWSQAEQCLSENGKPIADRKIVRIGSSGEPTVQDPAKAAEGSPENH